MSTRELPESWIETSIEDISVKCAQRVPGDNEEFIYIDIGSIDRELKRIDNPQNINGKTAPSRARKSLKTGDILVSLTRPNLNAVALVDDKYDGQIASTGFEVIRPVMIENRYIFSTVRSRNFIESITGAVQGALYPAAKSSDVQSYMVALPPLAEQKIIADKLDDLLARVESIKTQLENIPEILKKFRQSVLSAAVSGKLTEEWRRGNSFVTILGVLGNFVSIDIGHAFKSKDFTATGVKLLRGQNIEPGALKWNDTKFYPEEMLNDFSHLVINAGDIILAMDRPIISTGLKLARATENDLPCVLVQRVARFKDFVKINQDFLFILLSDPSFSNYIQPNQTGSDIPHISGKQILSYNVKIPSLDEQIEIVRRVEDLFDYIENIIKKTNNALLRINNLTQSILAKAFRGELTAQWREENPELISGLNSAEALLEKITAEKLATGTVKKRTKKTSQ